MTTRSIAALAAAAFTASVAAQPAFVALVSPGGVVQAHGYAISADGSTVVGHVVHPDGSSEPCRWSGPAMSVVELLGTLSAEGGLSRAKGVIADGGTVVGGVPSDAYPCEHFPVTDAFSWTPGGGMEGLYVRGICSRAWANFVSDDGSRIGGVLGDVYGHRPYYYDVVEGTWHMIEVHDTLGSQYCLGGSPDGRHLVGGYEFDAGYHGQTAFRTRPGDRFASRIDQLPDGVYSAAYDASADGYTAVGRTVFEVGAQAFVWTGSPCTVGLEGFSPETVESRANAIHPDHTLIGGSARDEGGVGVAALWGPDLRIRRLDDWLAARGVVIPSGWSLRVARDIRQVGDRVLVTGTAAQPDGTQVAFVAKAPHVSVGCPWDCGPCLDGEVGVADLLSLLAQWARGDVSCDVTGDVVDVADLLGVLTNWGPCPAD